MDSFFLWVQNHQLIMGIATPIVLGIITLVAAPAKIAKIGFDLAQWVRHLFGANSEAELKKIVDAFDQGLHSDEQTPKT
jgi:hypothetical protein